MSEAVLSLDSVSVTFGGNKALREVSFDIPCGFTGLLGANGAGKTTLLNVLSGIVRPTQGRVVSDGSDITGLSQARIARLGIGRTFQTPKLIKEASVLENVMIGLDGRRNLRQQWADVFGLTRGHAQRRRQVLEQLDELGLADRPQAPVGSLPLPAQKLVEIARALVCRPRVLLLDEPAAGLGQEDQDALVVQLMKVVETTGLAVLIIEHDIDMISRLCRRAVVLDFGRVIASGDPVALVKRPDVVQAYLGADDEAIDATAPGTVDFAPADIPGGDHVALD